MILTSVVHCITGLLAGLVYNVICIRFDCILFQYTSAKTGGGQIQPLQKAQQINWLP